MHFYILRVRRKYKETVVRLAILKNDFSKCFEIHFGLWKKDFNGYFSCFFFFFSRTDILVESVIFISIFAIFSLKFIFSCKKNSENSFFY